ncbi:putative uncharacterized protein [Clostridium sp. CAG:354]|jgi:uncharacterized protein (TIGR02391 family)|nr:TIGR02391 family protein [Clostridium sp.]MEE0269757.1 TIGR02391 family protein [Clostridia bacterium]CDE11197.1 putative uncharacterized protein [Clostridium sp. CAG:354]
MKDVLADAIKSHYNNKDYTEVVRDALLCMATEIRKKSDLADDDGVDLINKAFSEKNPLIKINKLSTTTEKNKQAGIRDLSKGLIEYFRNPMSHSKQTYSKRIADAILVLLDDVILDEIMDSRSINSIEDWFLEISNDLFPNTERYATNLVTTIPENKRLDLSVLLYQNRDKLTKSKDKVINELLKNLKPEEFKEYCEVIEKDLFGKIDENQIISLLKFITEAIWTNFSELTKTKLEDLILENTKTLEIVDYEDFNEGYIHYENGTILVNCLHILNLFSNKMDIIDILFEKYIDCNEPTQIFITDNYINIMINDNVDIKESFVDYIIERLKYRNKPYWYDRIRKIIQNLTKDSKWYMRLHTAFNVDIEEMPFKIEADDLPF